MHIPADLQEYLMRKYFPHPFTIGKDYKYTNPFRPDSNPGCYFDWSREGKLTFFDFASIEHAGDCISIIKLRLNMSFKDAIKLIQAEAGRFGYNLQEENKAAHKSNKCVLSTIAQQAPHTQAPNATKQFSVRWELQEREWQEPDVKYWWDRYKIPLELLDRYNIAPVHKAYKLTDKAGKTTRYCIYNYDNCNKYLLQKHETTTGKQELDVCYVYKMQGNERMKFYRPYNKQYKWVGSVNGSDIQGYDQLPVISCTESIQNILFIAASMKDALCLISAGYCAIAPQSESVRISLETIQELKSRFKSIYTLYDLDKAGEKNSIKHSELYNIPYLTLPTIYYQSSVNTNTALDTTTLRACKDVADCREHLTTSDFDRLIESMLEAACCTVN